MGHGPEHHIEHAEHAQHAAHDPFDRRVTVSIALVAAVLAGVTMAGHRAHNQTLQYQGEALDHQTSAGIAHSKAANMWALYQAQNIRGHMYLALANLLEVSDSAAEKNEARSKLASDWKAKRDKYENETLPEWKGKAESLTRQGEKAEAQAQKALQKSHAVHARADRFDFGELGLQLGVVLCSLAILTKGKSFWFLGLTCALVGLLLALTGVFGLFIEHH